MTKDSFQAEFLATILSIPISNNDAVMVIKMLAVRCHEYGRDATSTYTVLRAHKRLKLKIEAFSFTDIATMPPVRRRSQSTNSTPAVNGNNIASLRQKCAEKGLPTHGRRHVLVSRLQQHAQSQAEANRQSPESRNIQPSPPESAFSVIQLAQIQSLVSRSVEQAIAEISSNAARSTNNPI